MKRVLALVVFVAIFSFSVPVVWAAPVDLSGGWTLGYPSGYGVLSLEKTKVEVSGRIYDTYKGTLTLGTKTGGFVNYPLIFNGDGINYAQPGNTVSFTLTSGPTQWLNMTVGVPTCTVWMTGLLPDDQWMVKTYWMKVTARR